MDDVIQDFIAAREHYMALDKARIAPRTPEERERFYIELMRAWLELHYHAQAVAGLRFAAGMTFAKLN